MWPEVDRDGAKKAVEVVTPFKTCVVAIDWQVYDVHLKWFEGAGVTVRERTAAYREAVEYAKELRAEHPEWTVRVMTDREAKRGAK